MSTCPGFDENGRPFDCNGTPGTPWTPVWCPECDRRRLDRISKQLSDLTESFKK